MSGPEVLRASPGRSNQRDQLFSHSAAGWKPLRIGKQQPSANPSPASSPEMAFRSAAPPRGPAPSPSSSDEQLCGPRRTSGSFKHVASNSLVSNSIFKRGADSPASPSSVAHSPSSPKRPYSSSTARSGPGRSDSASSIGLGIASERAERKPTLQERRASREKIRDIENVAPTATLAVNIERSAAGGSFKPTRKARQSTAYNALHTKAPVSNSPFLLYGPTGLPMDPDEERKPSVTELQRAVTPPPTEITPRNSVDSPLRSALANTSALSPTRRMQGPRYPTPPVHVKDEPLETESELLTPRRKTVVFADADALEDVFEFEAESRRESLTSVASEDSRASEEGSSIDSDGYADMHITNDLRDLRVTSQSPTRHTVDDLALVNGEVSEDSGSNYGSDEEATQVHRPALDALHYTSPSRDFGVLSTMPDDPSGLGSIGSNGSLRRPLPRVPAPSLMPPASLATLDEASETSSPELNMHEQPRAKNTSRLPLPSSTSASSIYSLPEVAGPSPLMIDVDTLGLGRDVASAPPTLQSERARYHLDAQPAASPDLESIGSLVLKSGRPALSRDTLVAHRGKSPDPSAGGIVARPPIKPRAATLSDTRVPTLNLDTSSSSGGETPRLGGDDDTPLSSSHLEALSSPLERLISESSAGEYAGDEDSLTSEDFEDDEGGAGSPAEQLAAHREALLRKRRESKQMAGGLAPPESTGRPTRRRSLSTGDQPLSEPLGEQETLGLSPSLLDVANGTATPALAFSESLARDLTAVAESQGRAYRLRQHRSRSVIYGGEEQSSGISSAGDLEVGRHWRRIKRPSDVHINAQDMRRMATTSSQSSASSGKLFVKLVGVTLSGLPIPRRPTHFGVVLSNDQSQVATATNLPLDKEARIDREYELMKTADLRFRVTLRLADEPHTRTAAPPSSSGSSTLESKPSVTGLKKLFGGKSSPKKPRPLSAPVLPALREPITDYLNTRREFAVADISWEEIRRQDARDRGRGVHRAFEVPLSVSAGTGKTVGQLRIETFYIPALANLSADELPIQMDEAIAGVEAAQWQEKVFHKGSLSQSGLDCAYWRRRFFQVKGQQLLAINEVTREVRMAIDLAHCVQIEDLNVAAPSSGASSVSGATSSVSAATTTTDDDTLLVQLDHSFRLTMQDGGDVSFYADDAESKAKWLAILERVRGKDRPVPAWATALRRMQKEQYLAASASARTVGGGAAPLLPSKSSRILPPRTFSVPA